MSACNFCNNEPKYIFICPHCEKRFCKIHRRPNDHNCISLQTANVKETPVQIIETAIAETPFIDAINTIYEDSTDDFIDTKKPADLEIYYDNKKEESKSSPIFTIFNSKRNIAIIVVVIVSTLSLLLAGTLIKPNDYDIKLQQRYDALYEYYLETQKRNIELIEELNNMTIEMTYIQEQFNQLRIKHDLVIAQLDKLQEEYEQLLIDISSLQSK